MKRAAILVLIAAAAGAAATSAQATSPGRDGVIAFAFDWEPDDCGHACYEEVIGLNTVHRDGTGRHSIGRCTRRFSNCEESEPAWSPRGRRIAFLHNDTIWVMRADSSHAHPIFRGSAATPSWSPDGRHIVFSQGHGWITITRPDGSHRRRISPHAGNFDPTWSVGGRIAYSHYSHGFSTVSIVTRRADGRFVSRIKRRNGLSDPDFSPDGKLIAFDRHVGEDTSVWVARPDGSHMRRVVDDGLEPAWSPSGRFLAYSAPVDSFRREREIFIVRRDGSHAHQVGPSPRRDEPHGDFIEPAWQPLPDR